PVIAGNMSALLTSRRCRRVAIAGAQPRGSEDRRHPGPCFQSMAARVLARPRSEHRAPGRRHQAITGAGLLDVTESWEREVIAADENLFGRSHVVDAPASLHGLLRLMVEHHLPIWIAQEQ